MITVHVPKSAELAALLCGSGGRHERHLAVLANAADPNGTRGAVTFPASDPPGNRHGANTPTAAAVAGEVAALLQRARAAVHPHAHLLVPILRELGAAVPEPAPEPAPEPVPPPRPAPAPPPAAA